MLRSLKKVADNTHETILKSFLLCHYCNTQRLHGRPRSWRRSEDLKRWVPTPPVAHMYYTLQVVHRGPSWSFFLLGEWLKILANICSLQLLWLPCPMVSWAFHVEWQNRTHCHQHHQLSTKLQNLNTRTTTLDLGFHGAVLKSESSVVKNKCIYLYMMKKCIYLWRWCVHI